METDPDQALRKAATEEAGGWTMGPWVAPIGVSLVLGILFLQQGAVPYTVLVTPGQPITGEMIYNAIVAKKGIV